MQFHDGKYSELANPYILIVTDHYKPGFKGGGPIQTIANMVSNLKNEFDFRIITTDRDHKDEKPYEGIPKNVWVDGADCPVLYLSPSKRNLIFIARFLIKSPPDVLHLNSIFSRLTIRILFLRYFNLLPKMKVILAPRGSLAHGSLQLKSWKKRPYLAMTSLFGFYKGLIWHASNENEAQDTKKVFPGAVYHSALPITTDKAGTVKIVSDISEKHHKLKNDHRKYLQISDGLKLVFLSRISRVKNLDGTIRFLSKVKHKISMDIFGPIEDGKYWQECKEQIDVMPSNITVRHCGQIEHEKVVNVLSGYHFFILLTHGENFGHVIVEAFIAGLPVIISDKTPWKHLENKGIGWDIPLGDEEKFLKVIDCCVSMGQEKYARMSQKSREFGLSIINDQTSIEQNRTLFNEALTNKSGVFS